MDTAVVSLVLDQLVTDSGSLARVARYTPLRMRSGLMDGGQRNALPTCLNSGHSCGVFSV